MIGARPACGIKGGDRCSEGFIRFPHPRLPCSIFSLFPVNTLITRPERIKLCKLFYDRDDWSKARLRYQGRGLVLRRIYRFPPSPASVFYIFKCIKHTQSVNQSITTFFIFLLYLNFDKQHMRFYLIQQIKSKLVFWQPYN